MFHNPLSEDYTFRWDSQPIIVPAKKTVPMVYFKARHGAKHLVDHIILHKNAKQVWAELGLQRDDLDEVANKETNAILKMGRNTNHGREEIEKMILVGEEVKPEKKEEEDKNPSTEILKQGTEEEFSEVKNLN